MPSSKSSNNSWWGKVFLKRKITVYHSIPPRYLPKRVMERRAGLMLAKKQSQEIREIRCQSGYRKNMSNRLPGIPYFSDWEINLLKKSSLLKKRKKQKNIWSFFWHPLSRARIDWLIFWRIRIFMTKIPRLKMKSRVIVFFREIFRCSNLPGIIKRDEYEGYDCKNR